MVKMHGHQHRPNGRSALDLIEALDVEKMEGLVRQAFPFLKTRG
ncbi:MAG: hypothetical protein ACTSYX_10690 [Candidatus Thorarchaeota archaeon]